MKLPAGGSMSSRNRSVRTWPLGHAAAGACGAGALGGSSVISVAATASRTSVQFAAVTALPPMTAPTRSSQACGSALARSP